jgi:uncharacterized protein YjbI with pentapeptide repeats
MSTPDSPTTPPNPTTRELEQRKLLAEIAKLEAETRTHRPVEILKALAGVSGVTAAIVALVGLQVSATRWQAETAAGREEKTEARLQQVLDDLASKDASTQLAGLASVPHFLAVVDDARRQQLLVTLGSLLAVCESSVVSDAIVAYLEDIDLKILGTEHSQRLLVHLVTQNRNLSRRHGLARSRRSNPYFPADSGTPESKAEALGNAIAALVRRGVWTDDLSGIYCVQCDFGGVTLAGVNFNDAILAYSDFSEADLQNASFDHADLESALFVRADLRDASLTFLPDPRPGKERDSYFQSAQDPHFFEGPNFSCADLRGANFAGHPVFPLVSPAIADRVLVEGPKFTAADLAGANFTGSHIFGLLTEDDQYKRLPFVGSGGGSRHEEDFAWQVEYELIEHDLPQGSMEPYADFFQGLAWNLSGSNWTEAAFPRGIVDLFEQDPPSSCVQKFDKSSPCIPRGSNKPVECGVLYSEPSSEMHDPPDQDFWVPPFDEDVGLPGM